MEYGAHLRGLTAVCRTAGLQPNPALVLGAQGDMICRTLLCSNNRLSCRECHNKGIITSSEISQYYKISFRSWDPASFIYESWCSVSCADYLRFLLTMKWDKSYTIWHPCHLSQASLRIRNLYQNNNTILKEIFQCSEEFYAIPLIYDHDFWVVTH